MKATEQYFPAGLFIMLYEVVPSFQPVDKILKRDHSNESTFLWCCLLCCARWFQLFSLDKILKCDHSNESYYEVLFRGYYDAIQGVSNVLIRGRNTSV